MSEGSRPAIHNIEPRWDQGQGGWQGQGDWQGQGGEQEGQCQQCQGAEDCPEGKEDARKALDYIHPKGGGKGKKAELIVLELIR